MRLAHQFQGQTVKGQGYRRAGAYRVGRTRRPHCLFDFARTAKGDTEVPAECVQRSMQDIASAMMLVARSPVYLGDPVDVLVLTRTFWNGLDYHVTFNDDDELLRIDNLTTLGNDSLPAWATRGEFASSAAFDNGSQLLTSTEGLYAVVLTHRYPSAGTHVIRLLVSGQLTLHEPIQQAEVAVNVIVRDRPSLDDVIGHVTLVSQSQPAYVNESVRFLYAVEKVVQNVDYHVHFGNDLFKVLFSVTRVYNFVYYCSFVR